MEKCPRCRAKYDPSYTVSCSNCGALLVGSAHTANPAVTETWSPERVPARRSRLGWLGPYRRWVVIGVLVLFGIGASYLTDAQRGDGGGIVRAGLVGVTEARVGDCASFLEGTTTDDVISDLNGVPCEQPHDMEVYALAAHDDAGAYPGREALGLFGEEVCRSEFEGYVGAPYETEPILDIRYFTPEPDGWSEGDRGITCALVAIDGDALIGSKRGRGLIHTQWLTLGCYLWPDETGGIFGLDPLPCDQAHDIEVFATLTEPSGVSATFDDAALVEFGDRRCDERYREHFGADLADPNVAWSYFYPSPESWIDGDRSFTCFVERLDQGPMTGHFDGSDA